MTLLKQYEYSEDFKPFNPPVCDSLSFLTLYTAHHVIFDLRVLKSSEGRNIFKSELHHLTIMVSQTSHLTPLSLSHLICDI